METFGPHIASVIIGGGIMSLAFRKRPQPFFADGLAAFVPSLWLRADLEKRHTASHLVEGDTSSQNACCAVTESYGAEHAENRRLMEKCVGWSYPQRRAHVAVGELTEN